MSKKSREEEMAYIRRVIFKQTVSLSEDETIKAATISKAAVVYAIMKLTDVDIKKAHEMANNFMVEVRDLVMQEAMDNPEEYISLN